MTGFFRGEDIKGGFEQMYKIKIGYPKIKKKIVWKCQWLKSE